MLYVTTGDIARETGRDRDQISYALRRAGVKPIGRAGIVRLFPRNAVSTVREFLKSVKKRRIPAYAKTSETTRATAGTAMAQSQMEHLRTYSRSRRPSRRKLREQAAEVLLLLQLPLSKAERMEFSALLERRIERAYGERRR